MITDWRFFLQSFGAMGLGIVFLLVRHLAIVWIPERYAGVARTINSIAFVAVQVALISLCDLAYWQGLALVVVLLGGFIGLASWRPVGSSLSSVSLAFLGCYIAYWVVEKYVLPLGLHDWLGKALPAIAAAGDEARLLAVAGISFIGFKLIHFVVDYRAGLIDEPEPFEFLGWLLFFPALVAGPMQRFPDWQAQRAQTAWPLGLDDIVAGLQRVIAGMLLKFVLADGLRDATIAKLGATGLATAPPWQLALGAGLYTLYLFCDFAGYSHMAIGIGRFWGIRLPENFRSPLLARNLADYWQRWHITLGDFLRDYLFYPLSLHVKRLAFFKRHVVLGVATPPLITFLLAGIWHGAGTGFVIFGLLQGVGLAYLAVRQRWPSKSPLHGWWRDSLVGHACGAALTFAYVSFALVFFALPGQQLAILWHRFAG